MTRRWSVALAAITLAVLAGCAQPGGQPGGDVSGGSSGAGGPTAGSSAGDSSATGSLPAAPTLQPPTGTGKPTAAATETTLTGTVQDGVESGCLVLSSGGRTYLLLGGDRAVLKPGAAVSVRGRPTPGVVTTCMQGIPFQVNSASPR